jgi:hypothetical protein
MSRLHPLTVSLLTLAAPALALAGCAVRSPVNVEEPDAPRPGALQPWEVRYDTDATIDPASGRIQASTSLTFVSDGGTSVGLLLNRGLEVRSVGGAAATSHRIAQSDFSPAWNLIQIDLAGSPAGERVVVDVVYGGVLDMAGAVGGIAPTAIELTVENMWHPLVATFDREMVGTLRLRLPAGWTVVSSGVAQVTGDVHTLDMRVSQLDVPVFAAPGLARWSEDAFSVSSQVASEAEARAVLEAAAGCAGFLNARFGDVDPLPPVNFVIADRSNVAMARMNFVILTRVAPADRLGLHRYICHELAHYWTGSAGPFTPDHWMSESFAEYASAIYVREHFGADAFATRLAQYERMARGHGPVWTPAATARPSGEVMYRLGPLVLSRLEQRIGEQRFAEFFRRYMVHDVRTTEQLLDHLRAVDGAETEQWFRAELARVHSDGGE